jgi:hypothetical protein
MVDCFQPNSFQTGMRWPIDSNQAISRVLNSLSGHKTPKSCCFVTPCIL